VQTDLEQARNEIASAEESVTHTSREHHLLRAVSHLWNFCEKANEVLESVQQGPPEALDTDPPAEALDTDPPAEALDTDPPAEDQDKDQDKEKGSAVDEQETEPKSPPRRRRGRPRKNPRGGSKKST